MSLEGNDRRKSNKDLSKEVRNPNLSCFPINPELSRRVISRMTAGTGMDEVRGANIVPVLNRIGEESPALLHSAYEMVGKMQGSGTEIVSEYLLSLSTSYRILREQAEQNGAVFPSISQHTLDAYVQDVEECIPEDGVITHLDEMTDEDPGFFEPLREYAPDPAKDTKQLLFLLVASDTYNLVKRAEISYKMDQEMGFEEKK